MMNNSTYPDGAAYRRESALLVFFANEAISSASIKKFTYPKHFFHPTFVVPPKIQSSYDEQFFAEALDELEKIKSGEFLTYEEVFGEPQQGV